MLRPYLNKIKNSLFDLIFPIFCVSCRQEGLFLCESCKFSLKSTPPACFVCKKLSWPVGRTCEACRPKSKIYAFISPFPYGDKTIKDLIHSLKYNRVRSIAQILADLLADHLDKYKIFLPQEAIIIPIPLHKKRQRERGFNQAELIGRHLSARLNLKLNTKILYKTQKTKPQMELPAEERLTNLFGVFTVKDLGLIKNKIIILLDDVKTTGATLEEAAKVLKSSGAKMVWTITVAH